MPVYCYECKDCGETFEIKHSMFFEEQTCMSCNSENIFKIPSLAAKKTLHNMKRVGKVVDDYLKTAKLEIEDEKQKLRSREL